jgi:ABC-type xylose transport system permease subunit
MGPIIIIAVLALLGWLSVSTVRSLRARGVGFPWWATLVGCVIVGFCLGVWFGFFFEYLAVYQRHIRPSNAPTFFAVTLPDMGATLMTDQLKYRPRGLK